MTQSTLFGETSSRLVFIGGGNMAAAIIGGLLQAGRAADSMVVIEPSVARAEYLRRRYAVRVEPEGGVVLEAVASVVWAVKPQVFAQAALVCGSYVRAALHLSIMAGIRSDAIVHATGSQRVVRAMPNTPALIGQGMSGLYARAEVTAQDRAAVEGLLAPTGRTLWVEREADLDAVTALSGSGPAYVFYFVEAMIDAALEMGLTPEQGRQLALATFQGSTALAQQSDESLAVLRERVTSKGGTTHAALTTLESLSVKAALIRALHAARQRAHELGDEFGTVA